MYKAKKKAQILAKVIQAVDGECQLDTMNGECDRVFDELVQAEGGSPYERNEAMEDL